MGMFSSLFGSSGSDKADKLRQDALSAFDSVKTPELESLQVQLDKYVQSGALTPDQAEAALLNSNAYNEIKTDPSLVGAQKQALQQLQDTANQGGLTALDRSKIQDIQDTLNTTARGRNQAVLQNARERGIGGSGLELTNQLMNEQSAADQASRAGTDVAAQAQARALQSLQAAGQLGGQMEAQQYGEQANKAQSQNAIDKFNAETQNATNLYNTQTGNQAQAANLANAQAISNANTATANANKQYNAQQNQTVYQDELAKAQGKAGVLGNWANSAQASKDKETGADLALTGGLINAGTTALTAGMAGPAAGAVSTGFTPTSTAWKPGMSSFESYAEGGEVKMDVDDFKNEHNHLLDVLKHPSKPKLESEYRKQKEEMTEKGYCSGGMMSDGGSVEVSSTTAKAPELKPEDKTHDKSFMQRVADLIGRQADAAKQVDSDAKGPYDFKEGGKVPGKAEVQGDSPKNDTVPAILSPGEVVVPRSKVNDEEDFKNFMREVKKQKMAKGGMAQPMPAVSPKPVPIPPSIPQAPIQPKEDQISTVLKSLQHRITNLEGGR